MRQPARLLVNGRLDLADGLIVQIRIWELPQKSEERPHGLKYSLFLGRAGERIIGYDNEASKGDHRHYRDHEERYRFTTMENLIRDFWSDVRKEIDDE